MTCISDLHSVVGFLRGRCPHQVPEGVSREEVVELMVNLKASLDRMFNRLSL